MNYNIKKGVYIVDGLKNHLYMIVIMINIIGLTLKLLSFSND